MRPRSLAIGLLTGLFLGLAGCGFHLRGSWDFPYDSIYLDIPAHSEFGALLKQTIAGTEAARLAVRAADAQAIFHPTGESRDRKILSYSSAGQVREVQLHYRYSFRVHDQAGTDLLAPASIDLTRDLTYDDAHTLAKAQEEDLLWRDMLSDLTQQFMRRLAGRKPATPQPMRPPLPERPLPK